MTLNIHTDMDFVRSQILRWQTALLESLDPSPRKIFDITDVGLFARLASGGNRHHNVDGITLALTRSFKPSIVKINMPKNLETPHGLSAVAETTSGEIWLLRQGILKGNALSGQHHIKGHEFENLSGRVPDLITPKDEKFSARFWFKVCNLDGNNAKIRRETRLFVNHCFKARIEKDYLHSTEEIDTISEPPQNDISKLEGSLKLKLHYIRERDRRLVEDKKRDVFNRTNELRCEACDFLFSEKYGEYGRGFIEIHHNRPLHTYDGHEETRLSDLSLVCSNCHRMIHRSVKWLTVEMLRTMIIECASPISNTAG